MAHPPTESHNSACSARGVPPVAPAGELRDGMFEWLEQRRRFMEELGQALRDGFEAVAAFNAPAYLDCVERQEDLCQRLTRHDRAMPAPPLDRAERERAAAELSRMNRKLQELADVQKALIEHGGRSVRSFQRVWAMGDPGYRRPQD